MLRRKGKQVPEGPVGQGRELGCIPRVKGLLRASAVPRGLRRDM